MRSPFRRSGWHSFSSFLAVGKRPSRSVFPRRSRLGLEAMEVRLLLTATPNAAINMINSSGQEVNTVVKGGGTFTTSFLGTNDVTIQQLLSPPSDDYVVQTGHTYAPASPTNNNPSYLSSFVGSPLPPSGQQELTGQDLQGTGDGSPSSLYSLEGGPGDKLQINFAIPIGPTSQIILSDVDLAETVTVTAFDGSTPVSLSNWTETAYTGGTGTLPAKAGTDGWATWTVSGTNDTTGTLASEQDDQLADPVNVLTPGQSVTELVLSEAGAGNVEYQVLSPGSSLTGVSGTGTFGGTANLSATLSSATGTPLAGKPVTFELMEAGTPTPVGTATTGTNGVATLPGVSLAVPAPPRPVMAVFAGDATDSPTTAYGALTGNIKPSPMPWWSTATTSP